MGILQGGNLSFFNLTTRNSNDRAIIDVLDQSGNSRNLSYDATVTMTNGHADGPTVDNSTTPTEIQEADGS